MHNFPFPEFSPHALERGGSVSVGALLESAKLRGASWLVDSRKYLLNTFRGRAPSALVRIAEVLASHFRNRIGGQTTLVLSEIIVSARQLSNPGLLRAGEAEVL